MSGVAVAIVTENRDDQGLGRVKVRFPWRLGDGESFWARVANFFAGPDYGSFAVPDVGTEVLVAFAGGQIEHPYVLGMLWNGEDRPPVGSVDAQNSKRQLTSRDKHEVVFKDEPNGGVFVHTKDEARKVHLDGQGIVVGDDQGNEVKITSAGGVMTIASNNKLGIKSRIVEVEAEASLTLKAGGTVTIQGALVRIN
jgi:uncharacterized protein involved in type VI secretion and phage assembly